MIAPRNDDCDRVDDARRRFGASSVRCSIFVHLISSELIAVAARFEGVFARDIIRHAWSVHRARHHRARARHRARSMHSWSSALGANN